MTQTRRASALEAAANVAIGYGISVATNVVALPLFGYQVTAADAAGIGLVFTAVSLVRSYALRRLFNRVPAESRPARSPQAPPYRNPPSPPTTEWVGRRRG